MSLSIANPQENVPAGAGAGAAAPEPKKQLQVYFGGQGIPWCKGAFTVNTPNCAATQLVEHAALRLPYDRLRNLAVSVALALDLLRQAMLNRT